VIAGAILAVPRAGEAHRDRPPPAHTGGFDEPTCASCHLGDPVNAPGGRLRIAVPPTFVPGAEHQIEVRLARAGTKRAGFQLSVRHADGGLAGGQAGALLASGSEVQLVATHPVAYAAHTEAGTALEAAGEARWRLRWRAPAAPGGAVVFHATANAADDDDSALGDFVYAASAVSSPASPTAARR
jgi:hypothetical protein